MKCERCKWEDTSKCIECRDPERDEMIKKLQAVLKSECERIEEAKPIDRN